MKGIKKETVDYETLTVLNEMRERAFSDDAEDAHMAAALYCGALIFARERRLIQKDFANKLDPLMITILQNTLMPQNLLTG